MQSRESHYEIGNGVNILQNINKWPLADTDGWLLISIRIMAAVNGTAYWKINQLKLNNN